jgi:DNA polymerase-3 subunit beta
MKAVIQNKDMITGLTSVQNTIGKDSAIPVLGNVRIEFSGDKARLTTTSLDMTTTVDVAADVEKEGVTTVDARRLFVIAKELNGLSMEITLSKNVLKITCADSEFKLSVIDAEEFPTVSHNDGGALIMLESSVLHNALASVIHAAGKTGSREQLTGIYFECAESNIRAVGTDGRRLSIYEDSAFEATTKFILPRLAVLALMKLLSSGHVTIIPTGNLATFAIGQTTFTTKLIEGSYPNYKQVIPAQAKHSLTIDRNLFLAAISRVALMTAEESKTLDITIDDNNLTLHSATNERGEATESVNINFSGEKVKVNINPEYLSDAVRATDEDELTLNIMSATEPVVIKAGSKFTGVIMTQRV